MTSTTQDKVSQAKSNASMPWATEATDRSIVWSGPALATVRGNSGTTAVRMTRDGKYAVLVIEDNRHKVVRTVSTMDFARATATALHS